MNCCFRSLLEAVDEVISPVYLFGHSQLSHVHFCVNVVQAVLEVLWQAVDSAVGQGRVGRVQWCITHILQIYCAVQIL